MRLLLLAGLLYSCSLMAQEALPRWELGAGIAGLSFPDYRGAKNINTTVLPLPYLVYRGDQLKLSQDGLKLELFEGGNLELSLSVSASLPGSDDQDSPRSGMPELLPTFEAGPSLDYWLQRRLEGQSGWAARLRLPVRAILATNLRQFEDAGWNSNPHLENAWRWNSGPWRTRIGMNLGVLWGSERFHDYFYEVQPAFVTAERAAHDAKAGYSGLRGSLSLSARHGRWRLGFGLRYDELSGTDFANSPLVETESAAFLGFGLAYLFRQSQQLVRTEPQ